VINECAYFKYLSSLLLNVSRCSQNYTDRSRIAAKPCSGSRRRAAFQVNPPLGARRFSHFQHDLGVESIPPFA
jgi:hypothetical protein